jgi:hypothetical protein
MKKNSSTPADLLQTVSSALARLKRELQHDYERAYPALRQIIHLVLDEEETKAWNLSSFPHLIFPDLVEAHIASIFDPSIHTTKLSGNRASSLNSRCINRRSPNVDC